MRKTIKYPPDSTSEPTVVFDADDSGDKFGEMIQVDGNDDKLTVRWSAGFDAHMRKVLRDL